MKAAAQALQQAHMPTLDPATLDRNEIEKVLGAPPSCTFRYSVSSRPVLAVATAPDGSARMGVIELNGSLVPLRPDPARGRLALADGDVRLNVHPAANDPAKPAGDMQADLRFEVGQVLQVGYGGWWACPGGTGG